MRPSRYIAPLLLSGCVGLPPAAPDDGGSTSTGVVGSETRPGTTGTPTIVPTTTSSDNDSTTTNGIDSTTSTTSTTESTSVGTSSSSGTDESTGPQAKCRSNQDCSSNELCNEEGQCASVCPEGWGPGTYDYCLNEWGAFDTANLCGMPAPDATCIFFGSPIEAAACSTQGCASACDCPEPPPTGSATVTCGDITGAMSPTDCYLSCANGETCPDGMVCRDNLVCVTEPQPLPMYGNCNAIAAGCADGFCMNEGGFGLCVSTCTDALDCDVAPPSSANATQCGGASTPPLGDECYIPCSDNGDCPFLMECTNDGLGVDFCSWPS